MTVKLWGEKSELSTTVKRSTARRVVKPETFPASVYSSMSGTVFSYEWDIQGNTVIHSGLGATYTGTFSEDGKMLIGGWRPDEGRESTDGNTYDASMIRVEDGK